MLRRVRRIFTLRTLILVCSFTTSMTSMRCVSTTTSADETGPQCPQNVDRFSYFVCSSWVCVFFESLHVFPPPMQRATSYSLFSDEVASIQGIVGKEFVGLGHQYPTGWQLSVDQLILQAILFLSPRRVHSVLHPSCIDVSLTFKKLLVRDRNFIDVNYNSYTICWNSSTSIQLIRLPSWPFR